MSQITEKEGLKMENENLKDCCDVEHGREFDIFKGAALGLAVSAVFWIGAFFFVVKFL